MLRSLCDLSQSKILFDIHADKTRTILLAGQFKVENPLPASIIIEYPEREKDKLERKRKKLLEAHYNDAIPLDLMKSEQQKIAKQLAAVESQIKTHEHKLFDEQAKLLQNMI